MWIPNPLHPAVVHFPITLILLGTAALLLSFLFFKRPLALFSIFIILLGTGAVYFVHDTGSDAYDQLKVAYPQAKKMLNDHAHSADQTLNAAYLAAALAGLTLICFLIPPLERNQKVFFISKILFLISTLIASYSIFLTAKYGGEMIYGDILKLSTYHISETLPEKPAPKGHEHSQVLAPTTASKPSAMPKNPYEQNGHGIEDIEN